MGDWNLFSFVGDAASAVGLPSAGIGVVLGQKGNTVVVAEVMRGGPADKSGRVSKGDQIVSIDDETTKERSTDWVGWKLGGSKGSEVKLKLLRDGLMGQENVYVTLKRDNAPAAGAAEAQKRADVQKKADAVKERRKSAQSMKSEGSGWDMFSSFGSALGAIATSTTATPTAGIGVKLGKQDGKVLVAATMPNGPAAKSGKVQSGDEILSVDGASVEGIEDLDNVGWKLTGVKGSEVKLKLKRSGFFSSEVFEVALKRDDSPAEANAAEAGQQKKAEAGQKPSEAKPSSAQGASKAAQSQPGSSWGLMKFFAECASCSETSNGAASIGVVVKANSKGEVVVAESLRGAPAQRTGKVLVDDVILEVDGESVSPSVPGAAMQISGPVGSEITLKVRRPGMLGSETLNVALRRERIVVKPSQ